MADTPQLRISCRMVCTDQWLVTHVDPSWPVSQLKQVLVQKFSRERKAVEKNHRSIPVSPHKTRRRSLSPITFAAPRKPRPLATENPSSVASAEGSEAEGEDQGVESDEEDDEVVDVNKALSEAHRYKYNTRPSTSASDTLSRTTTADNANAAQEAEACVLITFSTTQILEDRFSLEWYGIHPDELLELHPLAHSLISLPRFSLDAYIAPYFAARVWALRVVGNALDSTLRDLGVPRDHQTDDEIPDVSSRSPLLRDKSKKKITLEWKERWAVIHQGIFSLCKERHDTHAAFTSPLSSMLAIRDSTYFDLPFRSSRRTRSLPAQGPSSSGPDIICVKFVDAPEPRQRTMSHDSLSVPFERHSSEASSPPSQGTWWRRGSREASAALSSSLASSASALMGSPSGSGLAEMWDALARRGSRSGLEDSECEGEDAVWIVLDMLTSAACSHILRILHRHAPPTCESSFLPERAPSRSAPSPIVFNTRTSSPFSPSDLPTPGPSSSYTFPSTASPLSSSPTKESIPSSPLHSHNAYPFPDSSISHTVPTRPATPTRPPPLRIDTSTVKHSVPYPDWRLALTRKARRAGLGSVGRAMELVMFGDEECSDDEDEDDDLAIEWARRLSAMEASPLEYPPRSRSRPRPARHVSDSAVDFNVEPTSTAMGEFDAPDSNPHFADESDESEAEWEGWLDAAIAQRRREHPAARGIRRTDTLETAVPGDLYWGAGNEWDAGRGSRTGSPSPAFTTPENETADPWAHIRSREPSGSEAEADTGTEGDGSSAHSGEPAPRARPTSYYGALHWQPVASSRGRRVKRGMAAMEHGGRTLSSYSSADSLLKRTMRTAIGGGSAKTLTAAKRASVSSAELRLHLGQGAAEAPPPRSASASPPLSRPSMTSLRSNASTRSHPLSPLCPQLQDSDSTATRHFDEAIQQRHPIPLPDMPMVPSGYTTFRHSALYARRSGARGSPSRPGTAGTGGVAGAEREGEERPHAGLVHGQSMQRLPVPMSMMMTTVSSTVSVGPGKAGAASR